MDPPSLLVSGRPSVPFTCQNEAQTTDTERWPEDEGNRLPLRTTPRVPTSLLLRAAQARGDHNRSSKLVMRVRFPSSALGVPCWSVAFFGVRNGACLTDSSRPRATRAFALRFPLLAFSGIRLLVCGVPHVAHERPEGLRDGLVVVAGGVLVNQRRADAGVPEPSHQLLECRARCRRERPARVTQVVEVEIGIGHRRTAW